MMTRIPHFIKKQASLLLTGKNLLYPLTLIRELGFNMMYLMEPWMFCVQETSQVTLLSCRTSFHLCPGGGEGTFESL